MSEKKGALKVIPSASEEQLVQALGDLLQRCSQEALAKHDKFSVGLSGKDQRTGHAGQVGWLVISQT